jgi:hypothetical protein
VAHIEPGRGVDAIATREPAAIGLIDRLSTGESGLLEVCRCLKPGVTLQAGAKLVQAPPTQGETVGRDEECVAVIWRSRD